MNNTRELHTSSLFNFLLLFSEYSNTATCEHKLVSMYLSCNKCLKARATSSYEKCYHALKASASHFFFHFSTTFFFTPVFLFSSFELKSVQREVEVSLFSCSLSICFFGPLYMIIKFSPNPCIIMFVQVVWFNGDFF